MQEGRTAEAKSPSSCTHKGEGQTGTEIKRLLGGGHLPGFEAAGEILHFKAVLAQQAAGDMAAQPDLASDVRRSYEEGAQLQLVRMVNGTLVTAAMILLAAASRDDEDPWFKITGAGPKDFRKNWQWREAGNRPFTITVGGVQLDYRTSPLYAFLAATGESLAMKHDLICGILHNIALARCAAMQRALANVERVMRRLERLREAGARPR